jgi:hypothetical protein
VELDLKSNIAPEVIVSKLQEKAKLEFIGVNLKPTEEEKNELTCVTCYYFKFK